MENLKTKLIILFFALIICFVVVESTTRYLMGKSNYTLSIYEADENLGWKLKANIDMIHKAPTGEYNYSIKTNSQGQRGPEQVILEDDYVILVIGDSFTFGQGVEEEEIFFNKLKGFSLKIINTGVSGYNTKQELEVAKKFMLNQKVDLVIVGFFAGNDVTDNLLTEPEFKVENGYLKIKDGEEISLKEWVKRNIKTVTYSVELIRSVPALKGLKEFLISVGLLYDTKSPVFQVIQEIPPIEYVEAGWKETEKVIEEMQEIGLREDIKFIILNIPNLYQVKDILKEQSFEVGKDYDKFYPEKRMEKIVANKSNVIQVTLLKEFRESEESLFFPFDPHWNKMGHEIAGNKIIKEVFIGKIGGVE